MLHPEDPPPHLLEAQKTCGGWVYFVWSGEIFIKKFLALPPTNIPGLKAFFFWFVKVNMCVCIYPFAKSCKESYPLN